MRTLTHSLSRLVFVLPLLGAPFVSGCATDRQVIQQAEGVHVDLEPAVVEDPELAGYLQKVGDRVIEAARLLGDEQGLKPKGKEDSAWITSNQLRFHLVNSKTMNAFTTGGEHMYIYAELFRQCKTEDELAAVVAHEYAHVYARHVHKGMKRQQLGLLAAAGAAGLGYAAGGKEHGAEYAGYGAGLALVGGQFLSMGYTREDEAEADKLGFQFYTRAGWDPARFGDFFQSMIDKGLDSESDTMSDHPTLRSRVEAANKRASALPPEAKSWRRAPIASPQKLAQLQNRMQQIAATMPSDQSLEKAQTLLDAAPTHLVPVDQPEQQQARSEIAQAIESQGR
jgi:predicted Zn-dependent protease